MDKKNIGLIGGGIWGRKILRDLIGLGAEVIVYEPERKAHEELLALGASKVRLGLPGKEGGHDGLIVASPSTTHRLVLEAVLPLRLPTFVEKPLTTTYADALALAEITHDQVFLMHIWLYHPGVRALAAIAHNEELGQVLGVRTSRANWTSPRRDTDSLWNLAPHDLTIAQAILGQLPTPRAAVVERHAGIARGMVAILGKAPYAVFEVSNRYERKLREVRLHCTEGVALLQDEKVDYISIYRGDANSSASGLREERRPFSGPSPLQAELVAFLTYLDGGPPPISDFAEGLAVVRTLHELQALADDA